MTSYTTTGLERLSQAIKEQAEQEFLEAINGLMDLTEEEEALYLNFYRNLVERAEQRIQSRGNER